MRRPPQIWVTAILGFSVLTLTFAAFADCVSCQTAPPGISRDAKGFPPGIAAKGRKIAWPFLNALADRDSLLAGAVWAGLSEWNSGGSEVQGTMGKAGKSYTYRAQIKPLAQNAVSLAIEVKDDRGKAWQSFEGVVLEDGRAGHFLKVTESRGRVPVYSWKAH